MIWREKYNIKMIFQKSVCTLGDKWNNLKQIEDRVMQTLFFFDYLPRYPEEVWKLLVRRHIAYTPTKINQNDNASILTIRKHYIGLLM